MHIQDKESTITKEKIKTHLEKYYKPELKKIVQSYAVALQKEFDLYENILEEHIDQIYDLSQAIEQRQEIWIECTHEPRNLDSGRHYFQIWYLSVNQGKPIKNIVWTPVLMNKSRIKYDRAYAWTSRAIVLSRQFDATDVIFAIIKDCGGLYCQP